MVTFGYLAKLEFKGFNAPKFTDQVVPALVEISYLIFPELPPSKFALFR